MFQPTREWNLKTEADECREEFDLLHHLKRELLEEMFNFGDDELIGLTSREINGKEEVKHLLKYLQPQDDGQCGAEFLVTAIILNVLNLRFEVCTLLFIHDPTWYERHASADGVQPFQPNWEFDLYQGGGKVRRHCGL